MEAFSLRNVARSRLGEVVAALAVVGVIAMASRFAGYAFAVSFKAITRREEVDPKAVGDETFYVVGALGLVGAFLYLTIVG